MIFNIKHINLHSTFTIIYPLNAFDDILTLEELQAYRKGSLSDSQQVKIRRLRTEDPFLADAVEGLEEMEQPEMLEEMVPNIQAKTQKLLFRKRGGKFIHLSVIQYALVGTVLLLLWISMLMIRSTEKSKPARTQKGVPVHIQPELDSLIRVQPQPREAKPSLTKPSKDSPAVSSKAKISQHLPPVQLRAESFMMDSLEKMLRNPPVVEHKPSMVESSSNPATLPTKPAKKKPRKAQTAPKLVQEESPFSLRQPDLNFSEGMAAFQQVRYAEAQKCFERVSPSSSLYPEARRMSLLCEKYLKAGK